jgi:UDP-perosamine 4-acetyltransferase
MDIGVALTSGLKRTTLEPVGAPSVVQAERPAPRGMLKRLVWPVARLAWFAVRPVVRSLGFRLRHYLMLGLQEELQRAQAANQRMITALGQELKAALPQAEPLPTPAAGLAKPAAAGMSGVVVLGAGGHAKVVIEILRAMGERVDLCIGGADSPDTCAGVPVVRGDEHLHTLAARGYTRAFVAIGANAVRRQVGQDARDAGFTLIRAISPQAVISPSARIGEGVAVMAGAVLNAEAVVEDFAILNTGATVDHDCRIGAAAHVGPQCALAGQVQVGEGSFLGIGCKVIPLVTIGRDVVVGAGSVVIADLPDHVTALGVPARVTRSHVNGAAE